MHLKLNSEPCGSGAFCPLVWASAPLAVLSGPGWQPRDDASGTAPHPALQLVSVSSSINIPDVHEELSSRTATNSDHQLKLVSLPGRTLLSAGLEFAGIPLRLHPAAFAPAERSSLFLRVSYRSHPVSRTVSSFPAALFGRVSVNRRIVRQSHAAPHTLWSTAPTCLLTLLFHLTHPPPNKHDTHHQ